MVKSIEWIYNWNKDDPFVTSYVFMNGGDRVAGNTPEEEYCRNNNIETLYNIGGGKHNHLVHYYHGVRFVGSNNYTKEK